MPARIAEPAAMIAIAIVVAAAAATAIAAATVPVIIVVTHEPAALITLRPATAI